MAEAAEVRRQILALLALEQTDDNRLGIQRQVEFLERDLERLERLSGKS